MESLSAFREEFAHLERRLADLHILLQNQTAAIARLQDELTDARRHNDWYQIQFSEMIRTIARDVRDIRATLICSVVSDGPVTADDIRALFEEVKAEAAGGAGAPPWARPPLP